MRSIFKWTVFFIAMVTPSLQNARSAEIHVSLIGHDSNSGTASQPFASIARAQLAARDVGPGCNVILHGGTYYLEQPLVFSSEDSGTEVKPVIYSAVPGETVVLSGGKKLELKWQAWRDGIMQAKTPAGLKFDQLFLNGKRQLMARYPNFDADVLPYNGYAADAFSKQRAAKWADPEGGFIHAMHRAHWGGYHYRITGKKPNGEVSYEGGWQNNRQMGMHGKFRFVENIFEELDTAGEWFHDEKKQTLYFYPPKGIQLSNATIEVSGLAHLIEFRGSKEKPVKNIELRGLIFRHSARTFMETRKPLLRSDWTIYRGGMVLIDGAEDCVITECEFDQPGGNGIFVNKYNRNIKISGCHIHDAGASAVCFVGDPDSVRNPLFEYHQQQNYADIDKTPGPKTDNFPADCVVDDCLIYRVSLVEKQATGVQVSMARGITIRHCSIYDVGRAGINISEGTFGGHMIEFCDVFDTVRETGDHGSFNSWGRDRFWHLKGAPKDELPQLALLDCEKSVIRNSRWRCDHGWDIDLDDGSSNYEIYNNLCLRGGLKLREGFHRKVYNNIIVNNGFHPHVWYENSGDIFTRNIVMAAHRPAGGMPTGKWGKKIDENFYAGSEADRLKFSKNDCDHNSISGDPNFIDPVKGDYRVAKDSPALKTGFKNFPMDQFGVKLPKLKKIASSPEFPSPHAYLKSPREAIATSSLHFWQGATIRAIDKEEFSAFGISKDAGGLHLQKVPAGSLAAQAGLQKNDLLQIINDRKVGTMDALISATNTAKGIPLQLSIIRDQKELQIQMKSYVYYTIGNSGTPDVIDKQIPTGTRPMVIHSISAKPDTRNESLTVLFNGKLEKNYGPVFGNGTQGGQYKIKLENSADIVAIRTWTYNMNSNRGMQNYTLYSHSDGKNRQPIPLVEVDTRNQPRQSFQAVTIYGSQPDSLGKNQVFTLATKPVTRLKENSSFQEFQVFSKLQ